MSTPEIRVPKKGQGVPKETPEGHCLDALDAVLKRHFPSYETGAVQKRLISEGYFAAGMIDQIRRRAEGALACTGVQAGDGRLLRALAEAEEAGVSEAAPCLVPLLFPDALDRQLEALRYTSARPGTGIQEVSQMILHETVIRHGVAAVLPRVAAWRDDPDPTVRRLLAEAFRPRGVMIPHITELKTDPTPLKALLEPLLDDPSDYVRKAVANNLNDVSKDNPEAVLAWAEAWHTTPSTKARAWILERGLRTLVKEGSARALRHLGYADPARLSVAWTADLSSVVVRNQQIPIAVHIDNPGPAARVLLIIRMDAPGKGTKRRLFTYQIWKGTVAEGATREASKAIHFVDKNSQPKERGDYHLTLVANGVPLETRSFRY